MKKLLVVFLISVLVLTLSEGDEKSAEDNADVTVEEEKPQSDTPARRLLRNRMRWQGRAPRRQWNLAQRLAKEQTNPESRTIATVPEVPSGYVQCSTCIASLQRHIYNMNNIIKQLQAENDDFRKKSLLTNTRLTEVLEAARKMENEFVAWRESMRFPGLSPIESPSVANIEQPPPVQDDKVYQDCYDAYINNERRPGVYTIQPSGSPYLINVLCDNGWTIIQRRYDGSEDFFRYQTDYKTGFGSLSGEFWLGLQNLHEMSRRRNYTLRVDVSDFTNKLYFAVYDGFYVDSETKEYTLYLGEPLALTEEKNGLQSASGMGFTTRDRDNDNWRYGNCARHYRSGFWLNNCGTDLNRPWCRRGGGGCMRWDNIYVNSSLMRIKPQHATRREDLLPPL